MVSGVSGHTFFFVDCVLQVPFLASFAGFRDAGINKWAWVGQGGPGKAVPHTLPCIADLAKVVYAGEVERWEKG